MFVSRSMTKKVVAIDKDANILEAREKMQEENIRHLPVVEDGNRLIGIVSDRDIRSALPHRSFEHFDYKKERERLLSLKVKDIMTVDPITVSPFYTIQDALLLIQQKRVGAFPVVDEKGRLKGIISVRDLLRAFINVLGIGEPGTLLCILVEEKVGQLKRVVDAISEEGISLGSILVARYWDQNKRAVFPYLLSQNVAPIKRKLQNLGFTLLDPMEWYLEQLPQGD